MPAFMCRAVSKRAGCSPARASADWVRSASHIKTFLVRSLIHLPASGFRRLKYVSVALISPAWLRSMQAGRLNWIAISPSDPVLRALCAPARKFIEKLDYKDQAETAVLMLEGRTLPGEDVADFVAQKCGVKPEQLFLVIAPTASLVGSIQVAARSAETGMHKLVELGFDVRSITSASGVCPLAPVAADDLHAIGRTNDAILYGAQVFYTVRAEERALAELIAQGSFGKLAGLWHSFL